MAAWMYSPGPSKEELELIGITLADLGEQADPEVWPDNMGAAALFNALDTQWRHSFNGPVGLDYAAIPVTIELLGLDQADKQDLFWRIRIMEDEARKQIAKVNT